MLSHLSLSICLITTAVQPPPSVAEPAQQVPSPAAAGSYGSGAYGTQTFPSIEQGDYCTHCGRRHHKATPFHDWVCPPCNLSQRYPYYPKDHGHYYFRPYHMQRVLEHQAQAVAWGEDPRNPHGQLVFERIYEQIRAEQASQAEPLPVPPKNGALPLPPKPEPSPDAQQPTPAPMPSSPKGDEPKNNEQSSLRRPLKVLRK